MHEVLRSILSSKSDNIDLSYFENPIQDSFSKIEQKISLTDKKLFSAYARVRKEADALILSDKFAGAARKAINIISELIRDPDMSQKLGGILINIIEALKDKKNSTAKLLIKISNKCKLSDDPVLKDLSNFLIKFSKLLDGSVELNRRSIANFSASFKLFHQSAKKQLAKARLIRRNLKLT